MALKIRLRQHGRNNYQTYRVVVANVRSPRDGKYIECLGWYNPNTAQDSEKMQVDVTRVQHWLSTGAELTENMHALLEKTAPEVVKTLAEKRLAKRAKISAQRRASRKKAAVAK